MDREFAVWVGIDWGYDAHQVCVLDAASVTPRQSTVAHSGAALAEMADALLTAADGDPSRIAVAIEVPRGPVVETLLDRSIPVFAVNPKQLDRLRDRHTSAGAKDDRLDAFVLADAVRTDRAKLRRVRPQPADLVRLRELSRLEQTVAKDLSRHTNRVRDQLLRYFPQLLGLCPAADEPWLWALLERAPTPERAARLQLRTLERLLRQHRIRRISAERLHEVLGVEPLCVGEGVVEAAAEHIGLTLPLVRAAHAQLARITTRVEQILDEACEPEQDGQHRDAAILTSLPGVGRVVAATMLAEAPQAIAERDLERLRVETGVAPITKRSGKSMVHVMRYACNARLRQAVYWWAQAAMIGDERWKAKYAALRARGHAHARALRSLADALLRVLVAMLRDGTCYERARPQRVRGAQTNSVDYSEAIAQIHA